MIYPDILEIHDWIDGLGYYLKSSIIVAEYQIIAIASYTDESQQTPPCIFWQDRTRIVSSFVDKS